MSLTMVLLKYKEKINKGKLTIFLIDIKDVTQ